MKNKNSITELVFNPRQKKLHHNNYHHYNYNTFCNRLPQLHHRIRLRHFSSTCSVINSFNKPSFKLSRMGRQQDPVVIQSSNSGAGNHQNHVQHTSQKSHSTLSPQTNINGHTTRTTTPKQYPFFPFGSKNQEMIMGINCLL
jgi:hypothetical protein